MKTDFTEITESPGGKATKQQLERLCQRYAFTCGYSANGEVLEVACGSGLGLRYLAKHARVVVGGDIDVRNVEFACQLNKANSNVTVLHLDAHKLPFDDESFDVILLCEAIYYLKRPDLFFDEAHRTLRNNGHLIISTVNRDWRDFHPSKYSIEYFSVPQLRDVLEEKFTEVELFGAFEDEDAGIKAPVFSLLKRTASRLGIIPGSLKSREVLKRLFIGRLTAIPDELDIQMCDYHEPMRLDDCDASSQYTIIYAVATK
jgi:SAM-dependent methyltransferase